jgi:hypothetical protein
MNVQHFNPNAVHSVGAGCATAVWSIVVGGCRSVRSMIAEVAWIGVDV